MFSQLNVLWSFCFIPQIQVSYYPPGQYPSSGQQYRVSQPISHQVSYQAQRTQPMPPPNQQSGQYILRYCKLKNGLYFNCNVAGKALSVFSWCIALNTHFFVILIWKCISNIDICIKYPCLIHLYRMIKTWVDQNSL